MQFVQSDPQRHLSPRQLARAIGVSESSVKRWADEGRIHSARTAGGHRRISLPEAIHFIRTAHFDVVQPEVLGLEGVPALRAGAHADRHARLVQLLLTGEAGAFVAGLVEAYVGGDNIADLCDGPIRTAMERVGERWQEQEAGVYEEHLATATALRGLSQLHSLQLRPRTAPLALGGAIAGDSAQLSSLMAAVVLGSEGYVSLDLGADTPAFAFAEAIDRHTPALVWLTANHPGDEQQQRNEVALVASEVAERQIPLVLGGRRAEELLPAARTAVQLARSMSELAAFARGLRVASGAE